MNSRYDKYLQNLFHAIETKIEIRWLVIFHGGMPRQEVFGLTEVRGIYGAWGSFMVVLAVGVTIVISYCPVIQISPEN
ncbi:hypothetical protein X798_02498 [Onchocerca flexuosa]|uniref:Uncharacterized protein n=1 Tax=Onchocerca flexuosa TaxID=387005 RepID=A0A238BZD9_9BILA|nr:hypothetical protein X798_02498 [Onchocerca flexuosa]